MATCKDCLHYDVCNLWTAQEAQNANSVLTGGLDDCPLFKDKSLCIELPCRLGEKIYIIVTKRPRVYCEEFSFIKVSKLTYINLERAVKDFGKTVFLSREDAERALANLKKEKEM